VALVTAMVEASYKMANNIATLVFAAPSGLNVQVTGSDRETGLTSFTFGAPNQIIDATHETDPAATISYDLAIKRGEKLFTVATTVDMLRSTKPSVGLRPNMPSPPIGAGQLQFVIIQRAGALTATNIRLVLARPLI